MRSGVRSGQHVATKCIMDATCLTERVEQKYHPHLTEKLPPAPMHIDNRIAIVTAQLSYKTKRRKLIDVKHHHILHHLQAYEISLIYTPGTDNSTNALKKDLTTPNFQRRSLGK